MAAREQEPAMRHELERRQPVGVLLSFDEVSPLRRAMVWIFAR